MRLLRLQDLLRPQSQRPKLLEVFVHGGPPSELLKITDQWNVVESCQHKGDCYKCLK